MRVTPSLFRLPGATPTASRARERHAHLAERLLKKRAVGGRIRPTVCSLAGRLGGAGNAGATEKVRSVTTLQHRTKLIGAVTAGVLAVSGVGAGVATAATDGGSQHNSPQQSTSQKTRQADAHHKHHGLLAHLQHGELTMGTKKTRVVDLQRGAVAAVGPSSITVRSKDGYTHAYTVDAQTKVRNRQQHETEKISDVHTGDRVFVRATKNGDTTTAKVIADRGTK